MDQLPRAAVAVMLSILLTFVLYTLLASGSLIAIAARHQRNSARMQHAQEEADLQQREIRRQQGNGKTSDDQLGPGS
jgi:hypothetical protein